MKPLELFEIAYFGILAVIGLLASADLLTWLEKWSGELSSLALVAFTFGSLLVGNPFTLPYAKETTPEEYWNSPIFLRVNRIITLVWALAFTVSASAGLYGDLTLNQPDNFWTGWIIPIGAMLFAFSFTEWYPDVASGQAPRAPGEPAEVAPPLTKLFDFLPPFVTIVGSWGSRCLSPTTIPRGWLSLSSCSVASAAPPYDVGTRGKAARNA